MIWVCGTGRCGTLTMSELMSGVHEPEPSLGVEPRIYYRKGIIGGLEEKLVERRDMKTKCVSDWRHSLILDLIFNIDQKARIIWLVREPLGCIKSMMKRGPYRKLDRDGNATLEQFLEPDPRFPDAYDDFKKYAWRWTTVNKIIESYYISNKFHDRFEMIFTHELPVDTRLNQDSREPHRLDPAESRYFLDDVYPYWCHLSTLRHK